MSARWKLLALQRRSVATCRVSSTAGVDFSRDLRQHGWSCFLKGFDEEVDAFTLHTIRQRGVLA